MKLAGFSSSLKNRKAAGIAASVLLVAVLMAVVAKLALAPLYARYDKDQCLHAYARARTRTETTAVDLHPYRSPLSERNARCGEVRGVAIDSLVLHAR